MAIRIRAALWVACLTTSSLQPAWAGTSKPEGSRPASSAEEGSTWVWVEAEGGVTQLAVHTFDFDGERLTGGFVESRQDAPTVGVGVGARLSFVTLGPRARAAFMDRWSFYTLGGELGVHVPFGRIEPHLAAELGYAAMADPEPGTVAENEPTTLSGYYGRVGGGFDVRVTPNFTVGAKVGWGLYAVAPPGVSVASTLQSVSNDGKTGASETVERVRRTLETADGTSWGTSFAVAAVLGVRY